MKVKLRQLTGIPQKLMCVKAIKELTGLGLRESKDIVDISEHRDVEFDITNFNVTVDTLKYKFRDCGYKLICNRDDALNDLLGDGYIYVIEYLNRDITYKIESGKYSIEGDFYVLDIEIGIKLYSDTSTTINNKRITIPIKSVSFEENLINNE